VTDKRKELFNKKNIGKNTGKNRKENKTLGGRAI